MNRKVGLRPSFVFSQRLDALSQPTQENVSAAGHALIVEILFAACVWHARQALGKSLSRNHESVQKGERTFDNRFRHGKQRLDLAETTPATVGMGVRGAMKETEERVAAKELSDRFGFRLINDDDWMFDEDGKRVSACGTYWPLSSGHDDERLDQPIRHGQWPRAAETIIKDLWHRCVALSVDKAKVNAKHKNIRRKLLVAASAVTIGSLTIPSLLKALLLVNAQRFDRIWHNGTYLAAAGLGALVALWWYDFDQDI